jgi:hypothetical protein
MGNEILSKSWHEAVRFAHHTERFFSQVQAKSNEIEWPAPQSDHSDSLEGAWCLISLLRQPFLLLVLEVIHDDDKKTPTGPSVKIYLHLLAEHFACRCSSNPLSAWQKPSAPTPHTVPPRNSCNAHMHIAKELLYCSPVLVL